MLLPDGIDHRILPAGVIDDRKPDQHLGHLLERASKITDRARESKFGMDRDHRGCIQILPMVSVSKSIG